MNKALMSLFATSALAIGVSSNAQVLIGTVTNQTGDSGAYYAFTQISPTSGFLGTATSFGVGAVTVVPIKFQFNIPVPQFPTAIQKAYLFFGASTNGNAVDNTTSYSQAMNGTNVNVYVDPADPTYGATYGNQIIFSGSTASGTIKQTYFPTAGATTYGFNSTNDGLTYSSPYVTTSGLKTTTFTLNTNLGINGKNQVLAQFLASGSGQFFATTATATVPEPSAVAFLLGTGVTGSLFLMRRKRK